MTLTVLFFWMLNNAAWLAPIVLLLIALALLLKALCRSSDREDTDLGIKDAYGDVPNVPHFGMWGEDE